eukprot:s3207_g4.t1
MQAACLAKLCHVTDAVQCIGVTKKYAELTMLQQQHLAAFNLAWGSSLTRPKHHHALHLGEQYSRTNTTPNCWGTEAKHRDYKQVFSHALQHLLREEEGGMAFSRGLMPRLLLRTIAMLNENPLSLTGFALKREFTLEEVARVTGLQDCKMATECQVNMLSLKESDFILHGHSACHAGRCQFFIEKNQELYLHVILFELQTQTPALRKFTCTNRSAIWKWSALTLPTVPSWWRLIPDGTLLCLP